MSNHKSNRPVHRRRATNSVAQLFAILHCMVFFYSLPVLAIENTCAILKDRNFQQVSASDVPTLLKNYFSDLKPDFKSIKLPGKLKYKRTRFSSSEEPSIRHAENTSTLELILSPDVGESSLLVYDSRMIDVDTSKAYGTLRFSVSYFNVINGQVSAKAEQIEKEIETLHQLDRELGPTIGRESLREEFRALLEDKVTISIGEPNLLLIRKEIASTSKVFELIIEKDQESGAAKRAWGLVTEPDLITEMEFEFQ